jgi:hypothetical protein
MELAMDLIRISTRRFAVNPKVLPLRGSRNAKNLSVRRTWINSLLSIDKIDFERAHKVPVLL